MKHVVTFGGGSGHSQVLKALKQLEDIRITGICPSTDSGGSTGILQNEYDGSGYTGDVTKCIAALCEDELLAKTLMFRYENGPLHSHSVKNVLFHALEKVGGYEEAPKLMGRLCGLGDHRILPVTNEKTELCARLNIGNTISGETNIDMIAKNPLWNPSVHSISDIYLKPEVSASIATLDAIEKSDYIIICPGDLYSSIIPTLLPKGVKEAIQKSNSKIILILNIMTKKGETDNYTAADFVESIEKRLGRNADYIICNNATIPNEVLLKYSLESKGILDLFNKSEDPRVISAPLVLITEGNQIFSDPDVIRDTIEIILKV
ncbi:MAG: gluconeogenesis factor YvcK family protein [bacterium]